MFYRSAIRDAVTLDFESERIQGRPAFPPKPVGLAVKYPDGSADYYAWGHPTGNNCGFQQVLDFLLDLWRSGAPILFHNAKFDLAICYEIFNLPELRWDRVHDTQFLAFLADPHSKSIGLKELAEDLLGWPPDEKDAIEDYVWKNRKALVAKYGHKITNAKKGAYCAQAWISKCPTKFVAPYAIGDVARTKALFKHLYPLIAEYDMCDSYDRERKVLPIFMRNERDGMRVNVKQLRKDIPRLQGCLERSEDILRGLLDVPDLNIDAPTQLADALSNAGIVDDNDWELTKTGQRSVSKENLLIEHFQDEDVAKVLFYRNRLTTALNMFMKPWLLQAEQMDGYITTNWNQTKGEDGGTRTGRPSTNSHNFLNIVKEFPDECDMQENNQFRLDRLPLVRKYVQPDPGETFIHRDFDGQEMRVFAHYECGPLLAAYQEDPQLSPHTFVGDNITRLTGKVLGKTKVKGLNFLGLYGGGVPAAAKELNCSLAEAKEFKAFHDAALPGRKMLNDAIMELIRAGEPIRTWGGRVYFAEPGKIVAGRMRSFYYKLINYLCQGSAADITKEALIRWDSDDRVEARFLVTVYDEINASAAKKDRVRQMQLLKEHMESIKLDLLMLSSGKYGPNWGTLKECA